MARNTPTGFLAETVSENLLKEINDHKTTDPTVTSLLQLCRDAVDRPFREIKIFLEEVLEPELLFAEVCFSDGRIFHVIRHLLDAIGTDTNRLARNSRVALKVADALYEEI